jgi:hypothetical protein
MDMTEEEYTLHRYYIWADRMRLHFDQELRRRNTTSDQLELSVEEFMYISLWYAQLYTVVEGWKNLRLQDSVVDNLLLQTDQVDLLRRYRNGVDHFQKDYFSSKFMNFVANAGSALWVRNLHTAIGSYFLQRLLQPSL